MTLVTGFRGDDVDSENFEMWTTIGLAVVVAVAV